MSYLNRPELSANIIPSYRTLGCNEICIQIFGWRCKLTEFHSSDQKFNPPISNPNIVKSKEHFSTFQVIYTILLNAKKLTLSCSVMHISIASYLHSGNRQSTVPIDYFIVRISDAKIYDIFDNSISSHVVVLHLIVLPEMYPTNVL